MFLALTRVDDNVTTLVNTDLVRNFEPLIENPMQTKVVFDDKEVRVVKETLPTIISAIGGVALPQPATPEPTV